jgi:hypothetical protein
MGGVVQTGFPLEMKRIRVKESTVKKLNSFGLKAESDLML